MSGDRTYPLRPLVGVGAVVLQGRRVLLAQRGHPPAEGAWSLPGGLIELGETAEQAVTREILEETAVEVSIGPILGLFQPVQHDADGRVRYHYVVIDFLAYYRSGVLEPGDDAVDLRWVDPADLDAYQLAPAASAMIERAFQVAGAAGSQTED